MRIAALPLFKVGRRPAPLLLFLRVTLPRLLSLFCRFPIRLLSRIVMRRFFAHGALLNGTLSVANATPLPPFLWNVRSDSREIYPDFHPGMSAVIEKPAGASQSTPMGPVYRGPHSRVPIIYDMKSTCPPRAGKACNGFDVPAFTYANRRRMNPGTPALPGTLPQHSHPRKRDQFGEHRCPSGREQIAGQF
jgi:hypothetical protein